MIINIRQVIYCNNTENIDNYIAVDKTCKCDIVPRIGESIYNYMWSDNVETKVVEVIYDLDKGCCDIYLEPRTTPLSKERIVEIANLHEWEVE